MWTPVIVIWVIVLKRHNGYRNGKIPRNLFATGVADLVTIPFDAFMRRFTSVAANVSVIASIAGSSTSTTFQQTEIWLGCVLHPLNTVMRRVVQHPSKRCHGIGRDIEKFKKIFRILKKAGLMTKLPEGPRLIQAVETRFRTYMDVAKRFIEASAHVRTIMESEMKEDDDARKSFNSSCGRYNMAKRTYFITFGQYLRCSPLSEISKWKWKLHHVQLSTAYFHFSAA